MHGGHVCPRLTLCLHAHIDQAAVTSGCCRLHNACACIFFHMVLQKGAIRSPVSKVCIQGLYGERLGRRWPPAGPGTGNWDWCVQSTKRTLLGEG